jgi:NADH-quinone oxidoreductase subunit H
MQQGGIMHWTLFTNPVATIAAMLSFLGAMGHSPFNVVMAPQENPIGPPTEYHGTFLGVLQTNRAILHVIEAILYMNLFFGGASNWLELIVKSFFVYFWAVFVGMVFPRFRVDQSIPWMLKIPMVLGVLSIVLLIF